MEQEVSTLASTDAQVQDEQAQKPTEGAVDSNNQTASSPERNLGQDEVGKTIAGVKKEFREKGRQEGYEAAMREWQQQQAQGSTQNQSPSHQSSSSANNPPVQPQLQARQTEIRYNGISKFEDWDDKLQPMLKDAQFNPDLTQAILLAQNLPNAEEVIYKLAANEELRDELLNKHPRLWEKELIGMSKKQNSAPQTVVKKVANSPVEPVKAPPASGGSKMTMTERVQLLQMKRKGIKSVS